MKYIYEVCVKQYYDIYGFVFRNKIVTSSANELWHTLILAQDENEATSIFSNRYDWKELKLSRYIESKYFPNKCSLVGNILKAKRYNCSILELKEELQADEFLEYCKQELYPIEIIIK